MKKWLKLTAIAGSLVLAATTASFAADKTVTIHGKAECAKCMLHEGKKCQTVIQAEKNGKTVNYYLAANSVAKDFHKNVCTEAKEVTATGTVRKADGKMELTASKIELAKK